MQKFDEKVIKTVMLEILHLERKNLRSRAMTDMKMAEEIRNVIVQYTKLNQ